MVNPKTGEILSWTWLVQPGEELGDLDRLSEALGGSGKFKKIDKESWAAGHASVKEKIFENAESGVSALVRDSSNRVFVISLNRLDIASRSTAGQK